MPARWTPRLRTVLVSVNLLLVALLVGGAVLLRLYEGVLVRRTEAELIAQAAHVTASYREAVRTELALRGHAADGYGRLRAGASPRSSTAEPLADEDGAAKPFTPIEARLDLATDMVLPVPEDAVEPERPADAVGLAAGAAISPALRAAQLTTLAGIRVVDFDGTVVATTRSELGLSLAHRAEVGRALTGEPTSLMRQRVSDEPPPAADSLRRGGRVRVFVAMPVVEGDRVWGAAVLSRTPMSLKQSAWGIRWHLGIGAATLLALVVFLAVLTSRTVARPMRELGAQAARVARGERGAATPLRHPGTHEVRQVSEAMAHMADTLEQRADYIRTFASGVSHEFKTPLTGIRGAVELLRDHADSMTAGERDRFLGNLAADAERLDRLVTRLNDLARADVLRPGDERTAPAPVVEAAVARHEGFELVLGDGARDATVRMGREVLEAVVANLLDNARQHGGPHVRVTLDADRDAVELTVVDDGEGISAANRARVFERFFTTARERGGSGLGLAIVRTLVEAHGGTITLSSRPGETAFLVHLPRDAGA